MQFSNTSGLMDRMVLDEHTPEGKTLKQFCHNFAVLEKNPATLAMNVRQFMDDLRAYIIERHADELAKLTLDTNSVLTQELWFMTRRPGRI